MKTKIYLSAILALGLGLTACNDDFLERAPKTELTEENAFQSYDNFKAFAWPLYEMFSNTMFGTAISGTGQGSCYSADINAGWMYSRGQHLNGNSYAMGRITSVASGNGWDFSGGLRRANIMLSHIDDSNMTQEEKDHWRAVGYFFHSYWYIELINRFGDVPWIDKPLTDESEERFASREDRIAVADRVLERLQWAEQNIGTYDDGTPTINQDCVQALISRFTLREATWRKYHELDQSGVNAYLNECVRVSEALMAKYPNLYYGGGTETAPGTGYNEMWSTESLNGVPGIILFIQYNGTGDTRYHNFSALEHMDSGNAEMTQDMVDLYLCTDGKTISNSPLYEGDKTPYATFRNRDPRLYYVVMPPYRVTAKTPTSDDPRSWEYTDNPDDRYYIDLLGADMNSSNEGEVGDRTAAQYGMKRLPAQNWTAQLVSSVPNFIDGVGATGFVRGYSGYYFWKGWTTWEKNMNGGIMQNTSDKPVFKIEEVLLNYAEAKWELGQFDQTVADRSINLLRDRVGVARMVVSEINGSFDPNRGKWYPKSLGDKVPWQSGEDLDPVLWEIRRERIVELMGEGFGFYDIRRWRMAPWFLNRQHKGMWATQDMFNANSGSQYFMDGSGNPVTVTGSQTEGYVYLEADPIAAGQGWQERYYLYQIPTTEILLNPALTQNPGWEDAE